MWDAYGYPEVKSETKDGEKLLFEAEKKPFSLQPASIQSHRARNGSPQGRAARTEPYLGSDRRSLARGVGGNDSWGAPVYPEYEIPGDRDIIFEFSMGFISNHEE